MKEPLTVDLRNKELEVSIIDNVMLLAVDGYTVIIDDEVTMKMEDAVRRFEQAQ